MFTQKGKSFKSLSDDSQQVTRKEPIQPEFTAEENSTTKNITEYHFIVKETEIENINQFCESQK